MQTSPSLSRRIIRTSNPHRPLIIASAIVMALSVFLTWVPDAEAQRRRRRAPRQMRDATYLRLAFAAPGACIEGTDFCPDSESSFEGLLPDIAFGGRLGILGIEGRGFSNPFTVNGRDASMGAFVGSLKLFPVSRGQFDPYLSAGAGFASMCRSLGRGEGELVREGFATHVGAGLDVYLGQQIALGAGFDRFFIFPLDEQGNELDEEGFWTARLNLTIYFGTSTSQRRPKKKTTRPKKRPKRVPTKKPRKKKELF